MTPHYLMSRAARSALLTVIIGSWLALGALAAAVPSEASAKEGNNSRKAFDVPAGSALVTLRQFISQAGVQLLYSAAEVKGVTTQEVKGEFTPGEAIAVMVKGTGLEAQETPGGAIAVNRVVDPNVGRAIAEGSDRPGKRTPVGAKEEEKVVKLDTFEVFGRKTLNMDIPRSRDGVQPFVIFDKSDIQASQATNLEDYLRIRLPMNAAPSSNSSVLGSAAGNSSINLRGMGANQTLILVDGRRLPGVSIVGSSLFGDTSSQPDINGIPLAAIERIDVLPSTAGGIYGGSATGGVINIVLAREYRGAEIKLTYGDSFDAAAADRRVDLNAGFTFNRGHTRVALTGSYTDQDNLLVGERKFAARSRALQLQNNPAVAAFTTSSTPPLGRTVNIRSVSGNLTLDPQFGGTALVSPITNLPTNITHLPLGYAGPTSDNGAALLANAGRYDLGIPDDLNGLRRGLIPAPTLKSISANARHEFSSALEGFVEYSLLNNYASSYAASVPNSVVNLPANAPNNPFQQAINVRFPASGLTFESRSKSTTTRVGGGLITKLPRQWLVELDYYWSRSQSYSSSTTTAVDTAATTSLATGLPAPDGRPALNALQEGNTYPINYSAYLLPSPNLVTGPYETILHDITLRFSGPVARLPAGELAVSGLFERRKEEMLDGIQERINTSTRVPIYGYNPHLSQQVDSYYLETKIPVVVGPNSKPSMRELSLHLSIRRDEYATSSPASGATGAIIPDRNGPFPALTYVTNEVRSTEYTAGLFYRPTSDIAARASFGTGFLPPSVIQITSTTTPNVTNNAGFDPRRGDTPMNAFPAGFTFVSGGNSRLVPERSRSWSAGLLFTPRQFPRLRLSVDYTAITKVDEIQTPTARFILDNENIYPDRVIRSARLPGDPEGWAGPINYLDTSLINIANTVVEALDIQADYAFETSRFGGFRWNSVITWQPHYRTRALPQLPEVENVGYSGGPLAWRGIMGLTWRRGPLTVGWSAQYYDSYRVYPAFQKPVPANVLATRALLMLNQGSDRIPEQIYHDLLATYDFGGRVGAKQGLLAGSKLSLGIKNVFDTLPPIVASSTLAAGYSPYGDPRLRRFSIIFSKRFGDR